MELDADDNNKDFLIKRIILNLENEKILPAIYNTIAYAKSQNNEQAKQFLALISSQELYRKIGFLDIIKSDQETATEYYDDDKDDDPYNYDEETEKQIRKIKRDILYFVANAIKEQEGDALEKLLEAINTEAEQ